MRRDGRSPKGGVVILSLKTIEARALEAELERAPASPEIDAVREKLARGLGARVAAPIPGQTTIDDHLEAA